MGRPLRRRIRYGKPTRLAALRRGMAVFIGREAPARATVALAEDMATIITAFSREESAERHQMASLRSALHAREPA